MRCLTARERRVDWDVWESQLPLAQEKYALEELVAETSAAVTSAHFGLTKHVKADSAAYLKSWLESIKEDPSFIKTIFQDVKRASNMIVQRVDRVQEDIDLGRESKRELYQEKTQAATLSVGDNKTAKAIMASRAASESDTKDVTAEVSVEQTVKESHGMKR